MNGTVRPSMPSPPHAPRDVHAIELGALIDSHGRVIHDLRLSVTDRCNYRCVYCMDPDHRYLPKTQLLSVEEYLTIARVCVQLGITKIRITGGEPTLYPDLDELMAGLNVLRGDGLTDLAMTSNASLVSTKRLRAWRSLGLDRLTLSLDSLREDRVARMTRTKTGPETVVRAIALAHEAGFPPLKVNAVIMRGWNDDEPADFADFARDQNIDMRLIEWMPLDSGHTWERSLMVPAAEMLAQIKSRHALMRITDEDPHSTSMNYTFADGAPGRIGIIASVTHPFCGACSRLRITADGKVRPCLFSLDEFDLRPLVQSRAEDASIARFIRDSVWTKQAGHGINSDDYVQPARGMSAIGG